MVHKYIFRSSLFVSAVVGAGYFSRTVSADSRRQRDVDNKGDSSRSLSTQEKKLKQVQIFFRHGARSPLTLIPNIEEVEYPVNTLLANVPHTVCNVTVTDLLGADAPESRLEKMYSKTVLKGGTIPGQLTYVGQEQGYQLGQCLKADYVDKRKFLSKTYNKKEIYMRSTNTNRTISTLRCLMAGIYGVDDLNKNGGIFVPVSKPDLEVLSPNNLNCPLMQNIIRTAFHNPHVTKDRLFLEKLLSMNSEQNLNFVDARDDIIARLAHGFPVPNELMQWLPMIERNAVSTAFWAFCGCEEERKIALKLGYGLALDMVCSNIDAGISGNSDYKMLLYSGHDTTLLGLLVALDIFDNQWPPFAADLRFEVYEDARGEHFVRVMYCGKEQVVKGCTEVYCPVREFKTALSAYTISRHDYDAECAKDFTQAVRTFLTYPVRGNV